MAGTPAGQLACPHCGRRFKYKAGLAGRAVKCKCGGGFRVPAGPAGEAEPLDAAPAASAQESPSAPRPTDEVGEVEPDDTYALNTDEPNDTPAPAAAPATTARDGKCPNCNQPIKPEAVLCVKCGFNLQEGRRIQTRIAEEASARDQAPSEADAPDALQPAGDEPGVPAAVGDPSDPRTALAGVGAGPTASAAAAENLARRQHIIDSYVPGALILFGMVTNLLYSYYLAGEMAGGLIGAIVNTVLQVVVWVPLAFVGMLIAVKLLDVAFGTLGIALYKLVGIALGPSAAWSLCIFLMGPFVGGFVGFFAMLIIYFALLTVLFDLEGWDAINLMIIIFVIDLLMRLVGLGMILSVIHTIF